MSESQASTTILVLHDPALNPLPFLQRLTSNTSLNLESTPEWAIDNKYYTANVQFDVEPLTPEASSGSRSDSGLKLGVPVVLYLFAHQPPNPLPPHLTRVITSEPRDIAIAIRVRPSSTSDAADGDLEPDMLEEGEGGESAPVDRKEVEWEEVEEVFLELGMEVIDECVQDKEEDMLLDPLEEIRITIQTHMWPNMIRKPLATRSAVELDFGDDDDDDDLLDAGSGSGESEYEPEPPQAVFPVGFARSGEAAASHSRADDEEEEEGDALWSREWAGVSAIDRQAAQAQFPSLELLNQQLAETSRMFAQLKVERDLAEGRRLERLDRLERALEEDSDDEEVQGEGMRFEDEDGEDFGPEEGEWSRLDDWLDGDEGYEALDGGEDAEQYPDEAFDGEVDGNGAEDGQHPIDTESSPSPSNPKPSHHNHTDSNADKGFEDDFADFHTAPLATQSRPLRLNKNGIPASLPMDPTPLLLHLQSVRAELAGVPDEDERRVRAAREVMAVLGLDMGDMDMEMGLGDDELELREDEGWAAGPRPTE